MDDYPNDSESFQGFPEADEEQQGKEDVEQSRLASSLPAINDILAWFDQKADGYGSIDALQIDETTDPAKAVVSITVAKRMKAELETVSAGFRADFAKYLDKQESE